MVGVLIFGVSCSNLFNSVNPCSLADPNSLPPEIPGLEIGCEMIGGYNPIISAREVTKRERQDYEENANF
jgi:hypothetical protein